MTNPTISILEAFEELADPRGRECVHQLDELLLTETCFMRWTSGLCPTLKGQHIAIDGKCVRGSHDGPHSAIHLVSAFSSAHGLQ